MNRSEGKSRKIWSAVMENIECMQTHAYRTNKKVKRKNAREIMGFFWGVMEAGNAA